MPHELRQVPASMVASGRRLAEVRINASGTLVGWVQRSATGASPAELVIRRLGLSGVGDGPEEVVSHLGIATPHPDGGGAWCWAGQASVVLVTTDGSVHRVSVESGRSEELVVAPQGRWLWSPCVSPDGQWLAWVSESDRDARLEAVRLFPVGSGTAISGVLAVDVGDADFVVDPSFGADGLLAWHAWQVPHMPWDQGWIGVAQCVEDPAGYRVVSGPRLGAGAVGQPRWRGNDLAWIDDDIAHDIAHDIDHDVAEPRHGLDPSDSHVRHSIEPVRTARWMRVTPTSAGLELSEASGRWNDDVEHGGPTWGAGQRTIAWDPRPTAERLLVERNEAGFGRLTIESHAGRQQLGRGVHRSVDWAIGPEGQDRIVAIRQGATTPTSVVLYESVADDPGRFERRTMAIGPVVGWHTYAAVEPDLMSWTASDGATIFGRLYRPSGASQVEALRTIVSIHGGPTDQSRVTWNPRYVAYLAAGWQVFVPDHRGSTGWGRDYQQAMNTRWGELDVSDTLAGVDYLVGSGLADANRVVVMGGSAGGFTTLLLLAHHPTQFAAGVALYPVTDLARLDETTHRFEAHYTQILVGPPSGYQARSPIAWADRIRGPLLLLHGTQDPVVGVEQSVALADRIRVAGGTVELVTYEGEVHSWKRAETTADEHRRVMELLKTL
jgi:acetyl esterase/lipase